MCETRRICPCLTQRLACGPRKWHTGTSGTLVYEVLLNDVEIRCKPHARKEDCSKIELGIWDCGLSGVL